MSRSLHRRGFLAGCGLFVAGGAAGAIASRFVPTALLAVAEEKPAATAEQRLNDLKIELPEVTPPANTYVPAVRVGELLFIAGHGPLPIDGKAVVGKVGRDIDLETAKAAARSVGLRLLAAARAELGSLDKIVRVVKTLGMVNCTPDFKEQPAIINGCSDLMVEVFGEWAGKGARSAVGMGSLPGGIPVEIEMVFQVRI